MGLFGFGADPTIARASVPEEFAGGFRRGQEAAYAGLGEAGAFGKRQASLADMLAAQAAGRGPSLAQMQFARALQEAQAAAQSQLASARGLSPAQAQQLVLQQQAAARQQAAGQSAALRLQEQMAAQANLGTALAQARQGSTLEASLAGQLASQAGQLGLSAQQLEQNRLMEEQRLRTQQEQQQEKGIATAIGTGVGGLIGFLSPAPGGAAAGAKLGAELGKAFSARGREQPVVPGNAKFKGDTRSNDTVPAMLSPGEIVLPRTVAQAPDAPEKARDFVESLKKKKKPTPKDYVEALSRMKELEARLNALETLMDLESEREG